MGLLKPQFFFKKIFLTFYFIFFMHCSSTLQAQSHSYLGLGPVLVQPSEAGEVLLWDARRHLGSGKAVGVGWISNNQHLNTHTHTQ